MDNEAGNKIVSKYGCFKSALEYKFSKLENLEKELYPDDSL